MAHNVDQPSANEENDNDNNKHDQAAQEQSETDNHNDENDDDDESSEEEEQTVDQATDIKPQVEQQTEQVLDQEGQESIDRQLQEEIAGTSRIHKGKEAQLQIEPLQRKDPYQKRLDKTNTQAALNEVIRHFIEQYQLPDFLRETLYQQTPNIQKEFLDSYAARGFAETTDEQFKQHLEYYINKASDRYGTQASTASRDRGLLKKATQLAGEAAQTLSAYLPEPGGNYEPAIQQTRPNVKVTPATPLQYHRRKIIRSTPIMATMTERPGRSRMAQPTMEQPRIGTQATPHPPGAYPPNKFNTLIKSQIGRKKTSPSLSLTYEQPRQYTNPGTPGGALGAPDDDDPDDDNPDDQDDQEHEENFKKKNKMNRTLTTMMKLKRSFQIAKENRGNQCSTHTRSPTCNQ